ncbi:choline dehydrogenase [Paraburkholderia sp. GAS199]|uniref:GMC family oxidoreductase n=1 Tax=Paraburkholderia sp. GAS199 TaxID=3035126 RepID=UPI003D1ED62E
MTIETTDAAAFAQRVRANQQALAAGLTRSYDFIVCGSGSSGSVVARRLAEDLNVRVLLLEAGGSDDTASVAEASAWRSNLGSERDWDYRTEPQAGATGRRLPMNMGKVLGGGSSINAMYWVRGHQSDWDHFAEETADPGWNHESVRQIYRRVEDWSGEPDPSYRGSGGLAFVAPVRLQPVGHALCESAEEAGIARFGSLNGAMTETAEGCAPSEFRIREGRRLSIFRSYLYPCMDQPNLTVLTQARVLRINLDGRRAVGVRVAVNGSVLDIAAGHEVVLSLGAVHTPQVLMLSGIGDEAELRRVGLDVRQHLPGVGRNFQDHCNFTGSEWEMRAPMEVSGVAQAMMFWRSRDELDNPDIQIFQLLNYRASVTQLPSQQNFMTLMQVLVRPKSRGYLRLTGAGPLDPVAIHANVLEHPDDAKALVSAMKFCRSLGASRAFAPFLRRESLLRGVADSALTETLRGCASTIWHQSCTARMGRDAMSVVDGTLRVTGFDNLRIADASVMPRITSGNTMAPCVVIGERCAALIKAAN